MNNESKRSKAAHQPDCLPEHIPQLLIRIIYVPWISLQGTQLSGGVNQPVWSVHHLRLIKHVSPLNGPLSISFSPTNFWTLSNVQSWLPLFHSGETSGQMYVNGRLAGRHLSAAFPRNFSRRVGSTRSWCNPISFRENGICSPPVWLRLPPPPPPWKMNIIIRICNYEHNQIWII